MGIAIKGTNVPHWVTLFVQIWKMHWSKLQKRYFIIIKKGIVAKVISIFTQQNKKVFLSKHCIYACLATAVKLLIKYTIGVNVIELP
jgi:hypothetical protein